MSKELTPLEAFERIKNRCQKELIVNMIYGYEKELKIIKTALKRLEKIETTTHSVLREDISKKLKALEIIKKETQYFIEFEEKTKTIYIDCALTCDKQEYDLLKEVLYEIN